MARVLVHFKNTPVLTTLPAGVTAVVQPDESVLFTASSVGYTDGGSLTISGPSDADFRSLKIVFPFHTIYQYVTLEF